MTSSKNNNISADSMIESLLERFDRGEQIDPLGQDILNTLLKTVEVLVGLRADVKLTNEQQTNKIVKVLSDSLKEKGIKGENFYRHLSQLQTGMGERAKSGVEVKVDDVARSVSNIIHSDALQSKLVQQKGAGTPNISSSSMEVPLIQQAIINLNKNQNIARLNAMNGFQRWFLNFMNGHYAEQDKKRLGFLTAIVDAMANNKFVGGALKDMTRLLGLMAGSWVKNKVGGKLGGILAGGTYILSELVASIIPLMIPALLNAGFTRLFMGPALGQITKSIAMVGGGAAGAGLEAVVGAGATATSLGLAARGGGILSASGELYGAEKIAELSKVGELKPIVGANGTIYAPGPTVGGEAAKDIAGALNKNTSILSKIFQPLNKVMSSPIMKVGGNIAKVAGPALGAIGGGFNLYGAYQSHKKGDTAGAWLKGIAGVTGIASLFAGPLAPLFLGISVLTGVIAGIRDWFKSKDEGNRITSKTIGMDQVSGYFPSANYSSSVRGSASTLGLQGEGGRNYVPGNLVNALNPKTGVSKEGQAFIKNQEGLRLWAYDDKTGKRLYAGDKALGTATIGYGHAINVAPGTVITQQQANKYFNDDLYAAKGRLSYNLKHWGVKNAQMPQEVYDMLVDAHFQSGYLPLGIKQPTALVNYLKNQDWEGAKKYLASYQYSSKNRNAARVKFISEHSKKVIPKASSHQTLTIQTPSVSSSGDEVKPPEVAKEEEKKVEETKVEVPDLFKGITAKDTVKKDSSTESVASAGLSDSIMRSISQGIDVPGNDTTFKVLTKMNNISIFGGQ